MVLERLFFAVLFDTYYDYHKLWIYELPTAERGCLLGSREAGGSKTYELWAPTLAASMPVDLSCKGTLYDNPWVRIPFRAQTSTVKNL